MVQVLEPVPSFAQSFAKSFGGGLGQGLSTAVEKHFTSQQDRQKSILKNRQSAFKHAPKYFESKALPYDENVRDLVYKYIDDGYDYTSAIELAEQEMLQGGLPSQQMEAQGQEETPTFGLEQMPAPWKSLLKGTPEGLEQTPEPWNKLLGGQSDLSKAMEKNKQIEKDPTLLTKPIDQISVDEIFKIPDERWASMSPTEREYLEGKLENAYEARGMVPFFEKFFPGLQGAGEKTGFLPKTDVGAKKAEQLSGLAGELYRDIPLMELGLKGATAGQRIKGLAGAGLTAEAMDIASDAAKEGISKEKTAARMATAAIHSALFGTAFEVAGKVIEKLPSIKRKITDLITSGATAQEVESAIQKTAQTVEEAGIDASAALKGNKKAVNEFQKTADEELSSLQGRVKEKGKPLGIEAQIHSPEEAIQHRERTAELLSKEPEVLERALEPDIEKGLGSKPETIAKRTEIRNLAEQKEARAQAWLADNKKELLDARRELIKAQKAKAPKAQTLALEENIAKIERQGNEIRELIRDAKHEQKHFVPRMRHEELLAQAEKTALNIREAAFSQEEAFFKETANNLKNDQKYLEQEMKLLERGELPADVTADTFLRVQKAYGDAYEEMLKKLRTHKNLLQNQARTVGTEVAEGSIKKVNDAIGELENRLKRLNANTKLQRDSLLSKKAVKGPSGAFTRNQIRKAIGHSLKENSNLQKAIFRAEEAAPSAESMGKYIEARFHREGLPVNSEKASEILEKAGIDKAVQKELKDHFTKVIEEGVAAGKSAERIGEEIIDKAKPLGKILWRLAKNPWVRNTIITLASSGTVHTVSGIVKKIRLNSYTNDLKNAKLERDRNPREGSRKILDIRRKMKEDGISKKDIERSELKAGIRVA